MSRSIILAVPLAMFALASSVLAGGPDCAEHAKNAAYVADHKGCTATKEECMAHMAEAKNHGWLGIKYGHAEDGTAVVKDVVSGSPAEKAGLRSGDVLYALNGIRMTEKNAERIDTIWKPLQPGSVVSYTVTRDGASKDLTVTLGKMPDAVYQTMVAEHMKEHAEVASN